MPPKLPPAKLEASKSTNPDEAAGTHRPHDGERSLRCVPKRGPGAHLQRLGLFGQDPYWLDAAELWEGCGKRAVTTCSGWRALGRRRRQSAQSAVPHGGGQAARCYNLLDLRLSRPILDNIIFGASRQHCAGRAPPNPNTRRSPEGRARKEERNGRIQSTGHCPRRREDEVKAAYRALAQKYNGKLRGGPAAAGC